ARPRRSRPRGLYSRALGPTARRSPMAVQPGEGDADSDSGATADLAGLELEPQHFHVDAELVAAYVDAIGDDGFAAFAAGVRWRHGLDVAPVLLLDRYMSTY